MAANNLFARAKAYTKAHPRTSYQDAIKILSNKKPAKKKTAVKKKVTAKKAVAKKRVVKRKSSASVNGIANAEYKQLQSKINNWDSRLSNMGGIKAGMTLKEKSEHKKAKEYLKGLIRGAKAMLREAKKAM